METENVPLANEQNQNENYEQDENTLAQEAEIVLITTSLGGIKSSFFSSLRAQQLLNCKKYIYFSIDANRDTSSAKNLKDIELFNKWKKGMILLSNENGIVLPQILIDGVPLGNDVTLQNLEDEGILDYIIARLKCPNCLIDKSNIEERCPGCKKYYVTLITDDLIQNDSVIRILQGEHYKETHNE